MTGLPATAAPATAPSEAAVAPSLPGFGWSDKPDQSGWGVARIAAAWEALMVRLGYDRFGAQGGDWGSMVTTALGVQHRDHLAGIHVNMPLVVPSSTPEEMTPAEASAAAGLRGAASRAVPPSEHRPGRHPRHRGAAHREKIPGAI